MIKKTILSIFKRTERQVAREGKRQLRYHPLFIPVCVFLVAFFLSLASFILFNGQTLEPADSHMVRLHFDGKDQVLPTRASTVGDLLQRLKIDIKEHDVVEPSLDAVITDNNFQVNVYRAQTVTVIDGARKISTVTAEQSPKDIAKSVGIKVFPEDIVSAAPADDPLNEGFVGQKIVIDRATPAILYLYGNAIPLRTHAETVQKLLDEKGVKLLEGDTTTPALSTKLDSGVIVFVLRAGKKIETREETISMTVVTLNDPNIPTGQTQIKEQGSAGKKLVLYEIDAPGGTELSRKTLQEVISVPPIKHVILKGTKIVESRISGDKSAILSAAGVPVSQQSAADFVIGRESGWNLAARNSGGCLGLGQACPGSKLIAACPNWSTDAACQVRFFSGYANGRYGGWNGAQQFWLLKHWW